VEEVQEAWARVSTQVRGLGFLKKRGLGAPREAEIQGLLSSRVGICCGMSSWDVVLGFAVGFAVGCRPGILPWDLPWDVVLGFCPGILRKSPRDFDNAQVCEFRQYLIKYTII
jgi:hypothetical protein